MLIAAGRLAAQADFECQLPGPIPLLGSAPDCEGLLAYNPTAIPRAYVSTQKACHFPTSGNQYAVVRANGPATPYQPIGGPFIRANQPYVPELRIPAPAGATSVSFCFEFFRYWSSTFNEGMDASIVGANGQVIQALVYADSASSFVNQGCEFNGYELAPPGPQSVTASFAPLPAGAMLSIVCWNDFTNYVDATVFIDNVRWINAPACPAAYPPPANDLCSAAIAIGGPVSGDTTSATPQTYTGVCGARDVWFQYVPSCTGTAVASLCASDGGFSAFHSTLGIFSGTCGVPVACNSEYCAGTSHRASFAVVAGVPVYISVGGAFGSSGAFTLSVGCASSPPANDECANALVLSSGPNGPFTVSGATPSVPASSCGSQNDVWFVWPAVVDSKVRFTLAPSFLLATAGLAVYQACGGPELACLSAGFTSGSLVTTLDATAGATYWIRVMGAANPPPAAWATGTFSLQVEPLWSLVFKAPQGPGSLSMQSTNGTPGWPYFTAVTFTPGSFPNGWFFGLSILIQDLMTEYSWPGGFPFLWTLDGAGSSPPLIVPAGVPSGLTIYAVCVEVNPIIGVPARPTAPVWFTIP